MKNDFPKRGVRVLTGPDDMRKIARSAEALRDAEIEQEHSCIRKWRDQPGTDRVFLFAYCSWKPEPFTALLIEGGTTRRFTGTCELAALKLARQAVEAF